MFESIGIFFAGIATAYILTWPAMVALFLFAILFEHNEARGWAIFMTIVAAVTAYFYFNIPFVTMLYYIGGYVVAGLLWSFFRYKRFIDKKVAELNEESLRTDQRSERLYRYHPSKFWDTIIAWVIVWPFSLIDNLAGDLIELAETLVKKVFRGVYFKIYEMATSNLK